ncbi:MAG: glycosyltransferase family 2 protein [Prevotella sp.]
MSSFLSIVIPVYNGALYLEETIRSILQQPCKDFELILINDGSTDSSLDICHRYVSEQVRVYSHENIGVSRTRNIGIGLARGNWIIFFDQDDCMRSGFYTEECRCKLLEMQSQMVQLIVCGAWSCDSLLRRGVFLSIEKLQHGIHKGHDSALSWGNTYTFNMNIYSRSLFYDERNNSTNVRFFDLPLDVETIFRHISVYSAEKVFFSNDYSFCLRRCNDESVSANWDWSRVYRVKIDAYKKLIKWHMDYFPKDKTGIHDAEKAYLRVINELIEWGGEDVEATQENLKLCDNLYLTLLPEYPELSENIQLLLYNPDVLKKRFHVSLVKKIIRWRWRIYTFFRRRMTGYYINVRKELLEK